jgi:hypothetical protein
MKCDRPHPMPSEPKYGQVRWLFCR